jgi:hypothetical protein
VAPNEQVAYGASSSPHGGVDRGCVLPPQMVQRGSVLILSRHIRLGQRDIAERHRQGLVAQRSM